MHLLAVFALLWQLHAPLLDVCPAFGVPTSGTGYDTATWTDYTLDAAAIRAVLAIDGESFWVGYERGGFAWPDDVEVALTLTFDGGQWLDVYWSAQTPNVYYALPFADPAPRADANGAHYGTHPCAAILMTERDYAALIAALN